MGGNFGHKNKIVRVAPGKDRGRSAVEHFKLMVQLEMNFHRLYPNLFPHDFVSNLIVALCTFAVFRPMLTFLSHIYYMHRLLIFLPDDPTSRPSARSLLQDLYE